VPPCCEGLCQLLLLATMAALSPHPGALILLLLLYWTLFSIGKNNNIAYYFFIRKSLFKDVSLIAMVDEIEDILIGVL